MNTEEMKRQFDLLKNITRYSETADLSVDLSQIEKIIFDELPKEIKKNAPSNFPELYFEFKQEYERFKTFILYDKLIGKNVVALGGGFSSGKSTFLNSMMDCEILPSDITPSTSVPAYLIYGDKEEVYAINTFESKIAMQTEDVMLLSHGFGRNESSEQEITLGHLLSNMFISTPNQRFKNLVMLDTPGYSKAETVGYSAKTDEKIARTQLNSANFILWFVQADEGTVKDSDIEFIKTLHETIPKLIIVNKADHIMLDELDIVVEKIKDTLNMKGIKYIDILTYSSEFPEDYQRDEIIEYLEKWNKSVFESRFAYNFKVIFTKCREYYDERLDEEKKTHSRLQHILADVSLDSDDARDYLNYMDTSAKRNIAELKDMKANLKELQDKFFTEIKEIANRVNIEMPEPSEIDLIQDKIYDPKTVLDEYCDKYGLNSQSNINLRRNHADTISNIFKDIKSVFNNTSGTVNYQSGMIEEMEQLLQIGEIHLNDALKYHDDVIKNTLGGN